MSVVDKDKLRSTINDWIREYVKKNNRKSIVIVDSERLGSDLLIEICREITDVKTRIILPYLDTGVDEFEFRAAHHAIIDSEVYDGLIVGNICRNEKELIRAFHKYGRGLADIFPLTDLYESEFAELLDIKSVAKFKDIRHQDLEWADRENLRSGIISNNVRPNSYEKWFRYTLPQKELISKLFQIEKQTRHKMLDSSDIDEPFLWFRNSGLVK